MTASRRETIRFLGAGLAAAAVLPPRQWALAQVQEEAENEPVTLIRKGIDRYLDVVNVDLLEAEARTKLSECVYVFIAHGAGEQWTLRENRRAFGDYAFAPHRMGGVVRDRIDTSITILGERLPHPVFVSPMGSHGLVHPEAEIATAQGMARSGGLLCVSSASTANLEDIASASPGPKWFQMYLNVDPGISRELLQRVKPAGFKAVILTIDAIGQGSSDEYVRLGRCRPWLPYGNFTTGSANAFKTNLSWGDLEFAAATSGLPVIAKGITRPEDAVAAVRAGAAAVQVSNHGGRALDGTPAAITVLPRIAEAMQGSAPIIMDGGLRRGMDVTKALALGANAVAVGRPVWWALTVGGSGGVAGLMDYFNRELVNTMLHLGADNIAALGRQHIVPMNG
ncbi:MAG: alpha-hydroxy-acid oxidizing protein [Alphaproteobacteria bacterium]